MASKPVMLLGNLASIVVTIAGILQALSWTIAGATILAILSLTTLAPTRNPGSSAHSTKKITGHQQPTEPKLPREKSSERENVRLHQPPSKQEPKLAVRNEPLRSSFSQTRSEFQKTMTPKIQTPKTIPTNVSPARPNAPKGSGSGQEMLRPIPPPTRSPVAASIKPASPKTDPNLRTIERGDYSTYDLQLDQGTGVTCEVTADAPVNVYILNEENLAGLDLGEEFWSETGEENVEKATLNFVAPQTGKWFLVVENTENKEVSARVNVRKGSAKAP